VFRAETRTWYRIALARPGRPSLLVAAAGEHMGAAVAAAERHAPRSFAIAVELAPDSDIPLGDSLGKSSIVELAELGGPPDAPVFHWPVGVLPQLSSPRGRRPPGPTPPEEAAPLPAHSLQSSSAAAAAGVRPGWIERPHADLLVIEAQTDAEHLTDLFMGMIERLPSADNLEVRMQDHFEDAGRADVWLTSRVDARWILRFLDDHDAELFGNGHLELSVYVRAHRATLRLTEHKTVVWLAQGRALDAEVRGWLGELAVPGVDQLVGIKDVPHYHYRPARSRDRRRLGDELYRQRLRRVDTLRTARAGD
jgi:hypothetical protein